MRVTLYVIYECDFFFVSRLHPVPQYDYNNIIFSIGIITFPTAHFSRLELKACAPENTPNKSVALLTSHWLRSLANRRAPLKLY
jgi:hypothetical protein